MINMTKERRTLFVIIAILAVAAVASLVFLLRPQQQSGLVAVIQVNTQVVMEIPLDAAGDGVFSIEEQTGLPIEFEIKEHAIRFISSNCPDKVCVHTGFLSSDMGIASCLPNRTVLTTETR